MNFVVNTRQIKDGYYCVMDIGGGSTDISFFFIRSKNTINYLASESYVMAANNVYELMCPEGRSLKELQKVEDEVRTLVDAATCKSNAHVIKSIKVVNTNLGKLIKKLFQRRVYFIRGWS